MADSGKLNRGPLLLQKPADYGVTGKQFTNLVQLGSPSVPWSEERKQNGGRCEFLSEEEHVRLVSERDVMWRAHEQSQIAFLQREHSATLRALHAEIEKLQAEIIVLQGQMKTGVVPKEETSFAETAMKCRLQRLELQVEGLEDDVRFKDERVEFLERKLHENELDFWNKLHRSDNTVAQLKQQLSSLSEQKNRRQKRDEQNEHPASSGASSTLASSGSSLPPIRPLRKSSSLVHTSAELGKSFALPPISRRFRPATNNFSAAGASIEKPKGSRPRPASNLSATRRLNKDYYSCDKS